MLTNDSHQSGHDTDLRVLGTSGVRGTLQPDASTPEVWVVVLDGGDQIHVPRGVIRSREEGGYEMDLTGDQVQALLQKRAPVRATGGTGDDLEVGGEVVVPVVEETVSVSKRTVEAGEVRVRVETAQREETVEVELASETVEVERVAVNRPVEAAPAVREEGDVTIVPVMAEEMVVTKRLILKEELHIRRVRKAVMDTGKVTLREQTAHVERREGTEARRHEGT